MRVEGEIQIGEANRWGGRAYRPLTGAPWPTVVSAVSTALVISSAAGLSSILTAWGAPEWASLSAFIGLLIAGVIVGHRTGRSVGVRLFRKHLLERGTPLLLPTTVEITPDALLWRSGGAETSFSWSSVSEVNRVGPYWVVIAQATLVYIPQRFFADKQAEAAFVDALIDRLEPAARARSHRTDR